MMGRQPGRCTMKYVLFPTLVMLAQATVSLGDGGESIETAMPIPSMPYTDYGNTCGHSDDYDGPCGLPSEAPDVVYSLSPAEEMWIQIDACDFMLDSKLYVFAGSADSLVACDSQSCGTEGQAFIDEVRVLPGRTYYIVVDGDGTACGPYGLHVSRVVPCIVDCAEGAQEEGEPPCVDEYVDSYNGGCDGSGWTLLEPQADGCADFCGRSCTYVLDGLAVRDSDWFDLWAAGGAVTASVEAEFPVYLVLVYGLNCGNLQFDLAMSEECQVSTVSRSFVAGQEGWLVIIPQVVAGVPESRYSLRVCGIASEPIPVGTTTWGRIKSRYRDATR